MKKCTYADQYKAVVPPKCNHGDPCDACKAKWDKACKARRLPRMSKAMEVELLRRIMQ